MIPHEAWQAFGGVAAVVILLGSVAFALRRLGILPDRAAAPAVTPASLEDRLARLERDLTELRFCIAETYIRRDDWVPVTSRVLGVLEEHTRLLARLEERSRHQQRGSEEC